MDKTAHAAILHSNGLLFIKRCAKIFIDSTRDPETMIYDYDRFWPLATGFWLLAAYSKSLKHTSIVELPEANGQKPIAISIII